MRRLPPLLLLLALVLAPPAAAAAARPSWAAPQIRAVAARGLMANPGGQFGAQEPLTEEALASALAALAAQTPDAPAPPYGAPAPAAPVSIRELDAALVGYLRLGDAARAFRAALAAAGLEPRADAGTEIVARLLGFRTDHPAAQDDLELLPGDPATRAEAAFSLARLAQLAQPGSGDADYVRSLAAELRLPALSPWQQRVLRRAISFVGYPYVWGGTSESPEAPFGVQAPGGFDCSGFVWRVYKTEPYPDAPGLAAVLRGRTTYELSGEVPKAERIPPAELEPGDVLFFGAKGPRSKPAQVDHAAIYLGGGWFVHSSGQGVALAPLDGWYAHELAWGRRPLREAGLEQ